MHTLQPNIHIEEFEEKYEEFEERYGGTPQFILWYPTLQWMKA